MMRVRLAWTPLDLESLECMAEGELEAAVTMQTEAGEVLEATGAHPQPPPGRGRGRGRGRGQGQGQGRGRRRGGCLPPTLPGSRTRAP